MFADTGVAALRANVFVNTTPLVPPFFAWDVEPYLAELSAEAVRAFLERNAPGTAIGWRWQLNWSGLYAIVVNRRVVWDNWRHRHGVGGDTTVERI
jgi:hypothetical protein